MKDAEIHEAIDWYLSSADPVLIVERDLILAEIRSHSNTYTREWATFAFQSIYANRSSFNRALHGGSSTSSAASPSLNGSGGITPADFVCDELERYVNRDLFGDGTPSLKSVEHAVASLKECYFQWLETRKSLIKTEVGLKLTEPVVLPPISLRDESLISAHRFNRQLLRTIAMGKKGFSLSKNDVRVLNGLVDPMPPSAADAPSANTPSKKGKKGKKHQSPKNASSCPQNMLYKDIDEIRQKLNVELEAACDEYYQKASDKATEIWKPILGIIEFIQRKLKELNDIVGREVINDGIEEVCTAHGMDLFVPFEMYWHPFQEILKRKNKAAQVNLESEVNSALAKYFRFYRDVTDGSDGIPAMTKATVIKLMEFIRSFMLEYSSILKTVNIPNRPDVSEKIVSESMMSFDGLTKVTEGRIKELSLDMSERKTDILDDIVEFIDSLSTAAKTPAAGETHFEFISKREIRSRFAQLDRKFVDMCKSTRELLSTCFPSLHLALIGYMMAKFFLYEKTFEETQMITDLLHEKHDKLQEKIYMRHQCMDQYARGVEAGVLEISRIFIRLFHQTVVARHEEHLQKLKEAESSASTPAWTPVPGGDTSTNESESDAGTNGSDEQLMQPVIATLESPPIMHTAIPSATATYSLTQELEAMMNHLQAAEIEMTGLRSANVELETTLESTRSELKAMSEICKTLSERVETLESEKTALKQQQSTPHLPSPSLLQRSTPPPQLSLFQQQQQSPQASPSNTASFPTPIGGHLRAMSGGNAFGGFSPITGPQFYSPWR